MSVNRLSNQICTFLVLPCLLWSGCSVDVASVEEEQPNLSPPKREAPALSLKIPTQAGSDKGSGAKADAAVRSLRGKMSPEEIQATLDSMDEYEQTTVILRFLSFTLLFYYSVYDIFPSEDEGLAILLDPPPSPNEKKYEFARDILLLDGWGREVQYREDSFGDLPGFKLRSLGPDGVESADDMFPEAEIEKLSIEVTMTIAAGGLSKVSAENLE